MSENNNIAAANNVLTEIYLEKIAPPEVLFSYTIDDLFKCAECREYFENKYRDLHYPEMCQTCMRYHKMAEATSNDY